MRLLNIIDKHVTDKEYNKSKDYVRKGHWASDMLKCTRQKYYSWKNATVTNPKNTTSMITFALGNAIEEWLGNTLKEISYTNNTIKYLGKTKHEIKHPKLRLPLRIETDIELLVDGIPILLEAKSAYGRKVTSIKDEGKPSDDYEIQVATYMLNLNYNEAHIIVIARDNGYRCEFIYTLVDGEIYRDGEKTNLVAKYNIAIDKLVYLEKLLEEGVLPERDYHAIIIDGEIKEKITRKGEVYKTDWQCLYCDYCNLCWNIIKGG